MSAGACLALLLPRTCAAVTPALSPPAMACDGAEQQVEAARVLRPGNASARSASFLDACNQSSRQMTSFEWRAFMNLSWWSAPADASCTSIHRFGASGDGGKMICEPNTAFPTSCRIVSVGLNGETSFEEAVHAMAPHCVVDGYDGSFTGARASLAQKVPTWMNFHPTNFHLKSWMPYATNGSRVQLLKIDCETCEHSALIPWVENVCTDQVLLEFHAGINTAYPCGSMFSTPFKRASKSEASTRVRARAMA